MTRIPACAVACCLLVSVVAALDGLVIGGRQAIRFQRQAAAFKSTDPTYANGALDYELRRLGRVIPRGAYSRARTHLQRMKAAFTRRHGHPAGQVRISASSIAAGAAASSGAAPSVVGASTVSREGWRWLGPGNVGGRIRALVVDKSSPDTMFAGSAGGGIWKTTNGGASWEPVDDFLPVLSVASLAIHPTNPNVMFAGTGEGYSNFDAVRGAGLFKSIDRGETWTQVPATKQFEAVNRVAISPNGLVLLIACADGGLWRSTDGGATFKEATLASGVRIGANQVVFNPADSRKALIAGSDGTVAYSIDGGATWRRSSGWTASGRVELAYARSSPSIVYASVNTNGGSLYRSTDGGVTFSIAHNGNLLGTQGWYNNVVWVDPTDPNHVLVGGTPLWQTRDAGASWQQIDQFGSHVDFHVIAEDPGFDGGSDQTVFIGNDGGVYKADLGTLGQSSRFEDLNHNLGVTQFYGAAGNASSGVVVGGTQDNGSLRYRPEAATSWDQVAGGDGGFAEADPSDPNYFYGEYTYLQLYRSSDGGNLIAPIFGGIADAGRAASFIAPFVLDVNDPQRMLAGGSSLWLSGNVKAAVPSWRAIKPPAPDDSNYISAISVAPGNSNTIWVGHELGDVYRTTNGRASTVTWTRLTTPISYLTVVTRIAIDPFDPDTVYITTGGFGEVHVIKTIDGGATWSLATGSGDTALPDAPVYDLQIDPTHDTTLYAATEMGVFVSMDGGASWELPQEGPANVCVEKLFWMGSTLVAATHGRGLFAIDVTTAATTSIAVTPERLDFAAQPLQTTSAAQNVTVANTGKVPVTIQSVWIVNYATGNDFTATSRSCSGVTLAPGTNCRIPVTFRPSGAGAAGGSLWIESTAPGSPSEIDLSGTSGSGTSAPLPSPWSDQDVGSVGAAGRSSYAASTFTVTGAGADVWGAADAFHFAYQKLTGDGSIVARVATLQYVAAWTKAGVMVRQSLDPAAAHASIFVSAGKGFAFQRRPVAGGTTTSTSAGPGAAPGWVKLTRTGSIVTASTSLDGTTWTVVGQDGIALSSTMYIGLVVSSHAAGTVATATFDDVLVTSTASGPSLPSGFATADIGDVGQTGTASVSGSMVTVKGGGADVWGTADALRYVYRPLPGDGTLVARVRAVQNVAPWTKAGIMIRQSLDPSSAHAFMIVSAAKGIVFQRRTASGGLTTSTAPAPGAAPQWLKLVRKGQLVTAYVSATGTTWTKSGQDTIDLEGQVWAGLAVSSHSLAATATATFDNFSVTEAGALPAGWTQTDVGGVGVAGTATYASGVFSVSGSGADVWNGADAFHFAYRTMSGDGELAARVTSVADVNRWSKAGVMIRETTAAGSAYAFMIVSPERGSAFQFRAMTGALAANVSGTLVAAPYWVKVVRAGSVITGYQSADGLSWQAVGHATISMASTVDIGLAVSSHDNTQLCKAQFDTVIK